MNCAVCGQELLRESEPMFRNGLKVISAKSAKRYNLHCLDCDVYFMENWKEFHYVSFESTLRSGRALRKTRRLAEARRMMTPLNIPPYCMVRYDQEQAIKVPKDFHEYYLRMRAEERKRLAV